LVRINALPPIGQLEGIRNAGPIDFAIFFEQQVSILVPNGKDKRTLYQRSLLTSQDDILIAMLHLPGGEETIHFKGNWLDSRPQATLFPEA